MKRYERYKPSKVEWIGEIPEHWEVKKLKRFSTVKRGASPRPINDMKYFDENGEFAWVRISDVTASKRYLEDTEERLSDLGASLSVKMYPDQLFLSIAGSVGKPIITKIKCCIHDGFVYFPYLKINPEYWYYIFLTGIPFLGLGKLGTQLNLNTETVGNIDMPLPTEDEIINIVNYLDKKTAKIEELIVDKVNLISLLEQEKELTISNAVTKGLNPDVTMKDSKVKWIGEIPEQWSLRKISHSFNTIGSGTTPLTSNSAYYTNGTIPWINTGDLNNDYLFDVNKTVSTFAVEDNTALKIYPKYSLVIAMYGATIGKIGITTFDACVNQACCVLAESDYFTLRYIYYWFIANKKYIIDLGYGGGQPNISQEIIKSLRIPCPLIEEQEQIVEYLDKKIAETNETVQIIKDEIELLKEYKETLIYEVITGKIDVRGCNETH
ncbi:MAG: restriction endonuclease subunit S [Candidatus Muirbacterium halophilum]|nr:restriction endonuclease subunit S [Candidatus Muirbacterium halophilum]